MASGRVVQRHVLYLGEINDAQRAAWCRSIEVFDEDRGASGQMALFPEDRSAPELACAVVQVKLNGLSGISVGRIVSQKQQDRAVTQKENGSMATSENSVSL